jgi:hypothetical protein
VVVVVVVVDGEGLVEGGQGHHRTETVILLKEDHLGDQRWMMDTAGPPWTVKEEVLEVRYHRRRKDIQAQDEGRHKIKVTTASKTMDMVLPCQ